MVSSFITLVGVGCSAGDIDAGTGDKGALHPTYYKDIYPIVQTRCVGCHAEGGIAPFSLKDASAVVSTAPAIRKAVEARTMPPWPPTKLGVPLRDARVLSDQEIATISAWQAAGAPLGDPAEQPEVAPAGFPIKSPPDIAVDTGVDYTPNPSNPRQPVDDFRCFAVDLGNAEAHDILGYRLLPGNAAVVHHAIIEVVDAADLPKLQAYDAMSPEPGWPCSGDVLPQAAGVNAVGAIGAWTPGDLGHVTYPGTGIPLPAHAVAVMQFHYNIANGKGADRSKLELFFAPPGQAVQRVMRVALGTRDISIPAGAKDVKVSALRVLGAGTGAASGTLISDGEGFLLGALGHGHYLLTNHRITLNPGTPSERVLLDLDWNFHWQGSYLFQEPVAVHKGDVLRMDCTYDNTPEHRSSVGIDPTSVDVTFGETSEDEMCLGRLDLVDNLP